MRRSVPAKLAAVCILMPPTLQPQANAAHSGASAQKECRATVGRPIVHACVRSKLQHVGGTRRHHVWTCRADAKPAVRACVERTVPHIVAHCRETVGRPMVQACVQDRAEKEGGHAAVRRALPDVDVLGGAGVRVALRGGANELGMR